MKLFRREFNAMCGEERDGVSRCRKIATTGSYKHRRRHANDWRTQTTWQVRFRSNNFDVLELSESGLQVEELTRLTWCRRSGRSLSIRELPKAYGQSERRALREQRRRKTARLATATESDTCGRRCGIGLRSGRQEVKHEVLGRRRQKIMWLPRVPLLKEATLSCSDSRIRTSTTRAKARGLR